MHTTTSSTVEMPATTHRPPAGAPVVRHEGKPVWQSETLLLDSREAWIEHRGEVYRLRLTTAGKLYLTK